MLKIYGSDLCPDCVACKAALDSCGAAYDFVNITASMKNLKEFLKLRDTNAVFDDARAGGYVGIPALLREDGSITTDCEGCLKENGLSLQEAEKTGAACRLDGSGC